MSESVLETHIRQYIEAQSGDEVVFSWQGGEPTLMGLDFFRRVVALQRKYRKPGQRIENDLQTNGVLIDDQWCIFLKQHGFLVGLSVDGPRDLHDTYRRNLAGKPSSDRVMQTVALLHKHQLAFSALCVVNRLNARKPIDVYRFIRDKVCPRLIQFIPAVEPHDFCLVAPGRWDWTALPLTGTAEAKPGTPRSIVTDWSVDPVDWGYFLTRVWDEWLKHDYGKVFVDQFENVISQMLGFGPQSCVSGRICGGALAVEYNGDVYSCDHFVYPEYRLGNLNEVHEGDLLLSEQQKEFGYAKIETLPRYCRDCFHLDLCWDGCPKNRFVKAPNGEPGLNYLCPGMKRFYAKAISDLAEIKKRLALEQVR